MKLFRILPLVVGSAAAGILASTSPAHALNFNFTFTGSDTNTVSGTIYGLTDNTTSAASSVMVRSTSNNALSSLVGSSFSSSSTQSYLAAGGVNYDSNFINSFKVSNGSIISASFLQGNSSVSFGNPHSLLFLGNNFANYNFLGSDSGNLGSHNTLGFAGATYTADAATVPFDIPGGATIPSIGALLALGAMRKVRKSIASNTRIANPVCGTVS